MLLFWIMLAAVVYFSVLGGVLVLFAAVSRMNHHWERAFREADGACDEHWYRVA